MEDMNYLEIILGGYQYAVGKKEWKLLMCAHFRREAQKSRSQYIEYQEFFYNCYGILDEMRDDIQSHYDNLISECNNFIKWLPQKIVKNGNTGQIITEPKDIALEIEGWEKQKNGYNINNLRTNRSIYGESLNLQQITVIEQIIKQVETELIVQPEKKGQKIKELPKELQTDEAKALFQKAIEEGFVEQDGNMYKWKAKESLALLAYFIDKANCYLSLIPKNGRTQWKPFCIAFGYSKSKSFIDAKKEWQDTGTLPVGWRNIDSLFQ